jgi:uncharacterized membrane protein
MALQLILKPAMKHGSLIRKLNCAAWASKKNAWRSLPGFQVDNQNVVEFKPDSEHKITEVRFQMSYAPPTSKTITRVDENLYRHLLGTSFEEAIQEDLLRFQALFDPTGS